MGKKYMGVSRSTFVIDESGRVKKVFEKVTPATHAESVVQVAMHTTYHRGQVATQIRALGGEPPLTDFVVWIWLGKPEPEWPS